MKKTRMQKLFGDMIPDSLPDSDYEYINNLPDDSIFDSEVYGVYTFTHSAEDKHIPPNIWKHSDAMMWKLRGYKVVHYPNIHTKEAALDEHQLWIMIWLSGRYT